MLMTKLEEFLAGKLSADRDIAISDARRLGITDAQNLTGALFEANVSLSAPPKGDSRLFMGRNSYFNGGGYLRGGVFIGRYCSIGRRVSLGAAAHASSGLSTSPALSTDGDPGYTEKELRAFGIKPDAPKSPVIIESDVWVGDGAVILPGVRVGTGAIIAANAVVIRDVDPYTIVGGVPARPLRARFSDYVIYRLTDSGWWDIPHDELAEMPIGHIGQFMNALSSVKTDERQRDITWKLS